MIKSSIPLQNDGMELFFVKADRFMNDLICIYEQMFIFSGMVLTNNKRSDRMESRSEMT